MTATFDAVIKHHVTETGRTNGYISFINPVYVDLSIAERFRHLEKVTVQIKTRRKARSLVQNRLCHAYFGIIASESGNTLETVKSVLKRLFLTRDVLDKDGDPVVNPKTGEVLTYVQDTSALSTVEMMEFTEQIRLWAMDFDIYLPLPDEQIDFKFK